MALGRACFTSDVAQSTGCCGKRSSLDLHAEEETTQRSKQQPLATLETPSRSLFPHVSYASPLAPFVQFDMTDVINVLPLHSLTPSHACWQTPPRSSSLATSAASLLFNTFT